MFRLQNIYALQSKVLTLFIEKSELYLWRPYGTQITQIEQMTTD